MRDDRLRLIFTCCHPALAPGAQVALTLRLLGGLTTPEIARAFLVPEPTMAQRLVRAKGKIRDAAHPLPRARPRPISPSGSRAVLAVVYLIFNEGHTASAGERLVRDDLCAEAIRLGRLLVELMPDEPEAAGPARAHAARSSRAARRARRPAATSSSSPTRTAARWDRAPDRRGPGAGAPLPAPQPARARTRSRRRSTPSTATRPRPRTPTGARSSRSTTSCWRIAPSPSSRSTARSPWPRSTARRPRSRSSTSSTSTATTVFHAIRADLLRRAGRPGDAAAEYEAAIAATGNAAERRFLEARREGLGG